MYNTSIAVEMMAGAGTQVLSSFEQIDYFMEKTSDIPNVGLCYDTCHVFGAGMDLLETLYRYQNHIKVIHLNGSKAGAGTHLDRHASIQNSAINTALLDAVVLTAIEILPEVPIILETPGDVILSDFEHLKALVKKK